MTAAAQRLRALTTLKSQRLTSDLLKDFSLEHLTSAFERLHLADFPYDLGTGTTDLQKALLEHDGFLDTLKALMEGGMTAGQVQSLMNAAANSEIAFFDLTAEQILAIRCIDLDSDALRLDFYHYFGDKGLQQPWRSILVRNVKHIRNAHAGSLSSLTDMQRAMLWYGFFASYTSSYSSHVEAALEALPANPSLQKLLDILHRNGVQFRIVPDEWHALRHVSDEDASLYETILPLMKDAIIYKGAFFERWIENGCQTHDLRQLVRVLPQMDEARQQRLFSTHLTYVSELYGKQLEGLSLQELNQKRASVLIYAIAHQQKPFLNLVKRCFDEVKMIHEASMLFSPSFYERIHLNSMTEANLKACSRVSSEPLMLDRLADGKYTFAELKTMAYAPAQYAALYNRLLDQSTDRRLLLIRQFLRHKLLPENLSDEQLDELASRLKEKPFDRWLGEDMQHIQELRKDDAVRLLSCWSVLRRFLPDLRTSDEACFAIRNRDRLGDYTFWADARADMVTLDKDWQEVCKEFHFTDMFMTDNADGVLRFLSHEGAAITNSYLHHEMNGHEDLRRIVQAEIMGRLPELKYHEDDLSRELNLLISPAQKSAWMENTSLAQAEYTVREHDDFYTTIQIGEIPTHTCLSYRDGGQSNCLLACFDANKKILMAYCKGKPVARAMIRLTKGGYFSDKQKGTLEFADLQSAPGARSGERMILFLERMYSSGINNQEEHLISNLFIALLQQKATQMGATLVVSPDAISNSADNRRPPEGFLHTRFSLYISRSKAGAQYLDSLSGANSVSNECSYRSGIFYVQPENIEGGILHDHTGQLV